MWFKSKDPCLDEREAGIHTTGKFGLGEVQFCNVEEGIWVANLIGQEGIGWKNGVPPIRYPAIIDGLAHVLDFTTPSATVHMPRMGAGLAGGEWKVIEKIVEEELVNWGVPVTVYDLPRRIT